MVSLMSILNMFGVLGAAPTIDPVGEWISREGGTGVGIIVFVVGLIYWATGKYGRMVALLLVGGLMFLISSGPEVVFNALSSLWKLIFPG
ncbi:TcpD family membrane protein [Staphylococcus caprae]|uniref:TcpD family membrane protein n=1 Tax=Staphylococcus caprae TaxID=29380 RepID=UPI003B227132